MDKTNDLLLIEKIQKHNDETALIALYNRHKNICYKVGSLYKINLEDEAMSLVYDAAKNFNAKKSKFSTRLWNLCFYKCMKIIKDNQKDKKIEKEYEPEINLSFSHFPEELLDMVDNRRLKNVLFLRFFKEDWVLSYEEIGQITGFSRQTVMTDFKKAIGQIKKHLTLAEK